MYACEGIPPALPIYYFQYVQFEKQAIHGRINTKIKATKEIRRHAEIRFTMSLHYNRCLARKKNIWIWKQCVCIFAVYIRYLDGMDRREDALNHLKARVDALDVEGVRGAVAGEWAGSKT